MRQTTTSLTQRRALTALVTIALLLPPSCATIFFPERQGQKGDKVDPNILILDGIGLLFFIIPGLIAYGVDFATGAIYLPPGVERGEGPFIFDDKDAGASEPKGETDAEPEPPAEEKAEAEPGAPAAQAPGT